MLCTTSDSVARWPPVCSISTVQRCSAAARNTWPASSAKYGLSSPGTASAMNPVRPLAIDRAERLTR